MSIGLGGDRPILGLDAFVAASDEVFVQDIGEGAHGTVAKPCL